MSCSLHSLKGGYNIGGVLGVVKGDTRTLVHITPYSSFHFLFHYPKIFPIQPLYAPKGVSVSAQEMLQKEQEEERQLKPAL